ncbi:hypothetical protein PR048_002840 [Dryococelus australis]|uniref:Uncharacterized protein n=1 Tax=Dryococelus australis TaxID=614101 RepID=A0ABQ9ILA4_9NEOP|nr:hypothetical protein PR048_002840 [Dryococelus australis]
MGTVVFKQYGAPPHFSLIVHAFPERWVSRNYQRFWAPLSPDLAPLDDFAWGFVKSKVCQGKIRSIEELKRQM